MCSVTSMLGYKFAEMQVKSNSIPASKGTSDALMYMIQQLSPNSGARPYKTIYAVVT